MCQGQRAIGRNFLFLTYVEATLATKETENVSSFSSPDPVFSVSCHKIRPTSNVSTPREIYEAAKRREREEPGRKITVLVER